MSDQIKTTLPAKYFQLLGKWVDLMANPPNLPGYTEFLHTQVKNGDTELLSDYEKLVLKNLLTCKDITNENLYEYFLNFSSLQIHDSLWNKISGDRINKAEWKLINAPTQRLSEQDAQNFEQRERSFLINLQINSALTQNNFAEADRLYYENEGRTPREDYEKQKTQYIKKYFLNNFNEKGKPLNLDDEQAEAIGAVGNNILVSARAGSGKTRVLSAKILYLLEQEQLSESEICVLAFNKNVPEEILKRVNQDFSLNSEPDKYSKIKVARTFHSLAKNIVQTNDRILVEGRSEMIKKIVDHLKKTDPDFLKLTYKFLKNGSFEVGKEAFADEADYYEYIRNSKYETIKGEEVKSTGEKFIADFLFEHGIEYVYEKVFYPESCSVTDAVIKQKLGDFGNEYRPDFYLPEYNLVWEHWALDEKDRSSRAQEEFKKKFNGSWDDYHERMQNKRWFWGDWRRSSLHAEDQNAKAIMDVNELLETKAKDLLAGRAAFEEELGNMLLQHGVKLKNPDYKELSEQVWTRTKDRLTLLMEQFINRFQQQYFDDKPYFFIQLHKEFQTKERLFQFAQLGLLVLDEYEAQLRLAKKSEYLAEYQGYSLDFNQLIAQAIDAIRSGSADKYIKGLKWILIDEYQDFSKLFFTLVQEIKQRNPEVKLFCVGDSWQAINRFAGAETKYFDEFQSYFPDCNIKNITTNYRSNSEIVQRSNEFMRRSGFKGAPAKTIKQGTTGQVQIKYLDKVFVESREGRRNYWSDLDYYRQILEFRGTLTPQVLRKAQYLKLCVDIVNAENDKKFMFLVRNNHFLGAEKAWFIDALKRILVKKGVYHSFDEALEHIAIATMNSSKGLECDVVVLFNVERNVIPKYHQDADLFRIFGEDYGTIIADQERLFYVAVTRAKERLYIVTKKGKESWFLNAY